jgi:anti-anti-sigma regulatory factor
MSDALLLRSFQEITMTGFVDRKSVSQVVRRIRRRARQRPRTSFFLDCTDVRDFSGFALAELSRVRQELQWQGCDVALTHCTDYVKERLAVPLFESLVLQQQITCP